MGGTGGARTMLLMHGAVQVLLVGLLGGGTPGGGGICSAAPDAGNEGLLQLSVLRKSYKSG